jgi:hypothetical protein
MAAAALVAIPAGAEEDLVRPQSMDLYHEARSRCLAITEHWTGEMRAFLPTLIDICAFGYTAGRVEGWQAGYREGYKLGEDGGYRFARTDCLEGRIKPE